MVIMVVHNKMCIAQWINGVSFIALFSPRLTGVFLAGIKSISWMPAKNMLA